MYSVSSKGKNCFEVEISHVCDVCKRFESKRRLEVDEGDDRVTRVERLLDTPCYIIDFLPKQVPKDCGGQFFEVEDYLLNYYERY